VTDLAVIDGDLWAVGSHIAREREGQWVAVETPRNGVLSALSWDGEHAWAVGKGEIWQYEAGQWGLAQELPDLLLTGIATSDGAGWAVGRYKQVGLGVVLALQDAVWTVVADWPVALNDVAVVSDSTAVAVSDAGEILAMSRDSGNVFISLEHSVVDAVPLLAIDDRDGVTWAVGGRIGLGDGAPRRVMLRRIDAGPWFTLVNEENWPLHDVWAQTRDSVWSVGYRGQTGAFRDGEWVDLGTAGVVGSLIAHNVVLGTPDGRLVTANSRGAIFEYEASRWVTLRGDRRLTGVVVFDDSTAWAVGSPGPPLHRDRHGTWSYSATPSLEHLFDVDGTSSKDVWAVGVAGLLAHFTGTSWEVLDPPLTDMNLINVRVTHNGMLIVGRRQEGGLETSIFLYEPSTGWDTLWNGRGGWEVAINDADMVPGTGEVWAVGTRSLLHRDSQGHWQLQEFPEALYALELVGDTGWAVGEGKIWKLTNGTWAVEYDVGDRTQILGLDMVSATRGVAVGWRGRIFEYESGTWRKVRETSNDEWARGGDALVFSDVSLGAKGAVAVAGPETIFASTPLAENSQLYLPSTLQRIKFASVIQRPLQSAFMTRVLEPCYTSGQSTVMLVE
jgi:hypothetical protein